MIVFLMHIYTKCQAIFVGIKSCGCCLMEYLLFADLVLVRRAEKHAHAK